MTELEKLREKLVSLSRCIDRVVRFQSIEFKKMLLDFDAQDIVSQNLERAVERCVQIATIIAIYKGMSLQPGMSAVFDQIKSLGVIDDSLCQTMKRAVAFRNRAVHGYETLDWELVHKLIQDGCSDLKIFGAKVLVWAEIEMK